MRSAVLSSLSRTRLMRLRLLRPVLLLLRGISKPLSPASGVPHSGRGSADFFICYRELLA